MPSRRKRSRCARHYANGAVMKRLSRSKSSRSSRKKLYKQACGGRGYYWVRSHQAKGPNGGCITVRGHCQRMPGWRH